MLILTADITEGFEKAKSFSEQLWDKLVGAIPTIMFAAVAFVIGIILSKIIVKIIGKCMNRSHADNAATSFLLSVIRIILYTVTIIITLSILNVPMSSIITIIGAAGLAISLALQNSLSNLAGGFIILFSKPFKSGDTIETEGSVGVVDSISILYTKLITADNKTTYIPNGKISGAKIINYTERPTRRLDMSFDISYDNDFEIAKSVINTIAVENDYVLDSPVPQVRLGMHKENAQEIVGRFWVENEDYAEAFHSISESVRKEFDKKNIKTPRNKLDVRINDDK